jgi:hypothetical protein
MIWEYGWISIIFTIQLSPNGRLGEVRFPTQSQFYPDPTLSVTRYQCSSLIQKQRFNPGSEPATRAPQTMAGWEFVIVIHRRDMPRERS